MSTVRTTAVMKTDLRGYSERVAQISARELGELLRHHQALAEPIFTAHEGSIVKGEGDSFWTVFPSVTAAALAATKLQEELRAEQSGVPDEIRLAIRASITLGDILHQDNDIFGEAVNLAARIETVTPADEIYLSDAAWQSLKKSEVPTSFVSEFALKGFAAPQRVYKVDRVHRTRVLENQAIVFTDVKGFSKFATTNDMADVEKVLSFWEGAHQRLAQASGGRVRAFQGDSFFLTFDTVDGAIAFFAALRDGWREFAGGCRAAQALGFSAGLNVGTLYQWRGCIFGPAANEASASQVMAGSLAKPGEARLVITDAAKSKISDGASIARLRPVAGRAQAYEFGE